MNRFVVLSFLFLGWGFWELSGGNDFEPSYRSAARAPVAQAPLEPTPVAKGPLSLAPIADHTVESTAEPTGDVTVKSARISAPAVSSVLAPGVAPDAALSTNNLEIQVPSIRALPTVAIAPAQTATGTATAGIFAADRATGSILQHANVLLFTTPTLSEPFVILPATTVVTPTLPDPINTPVTEVPFAALEPDLRIVKGSRVNLRGGPGTSHGVIATLVRGQTVEILSDEGAGWVKLRDKDSGHIGWMARKMLDPSNRN